MGCGQAGGYGDPFEFDPLSVEFNADPIPTYRHLRQRAPVHYWKAGRGYLVSRYEDVLTVLRDPRFVTVPRKGRRERPVLRSEGERIHRLLMDHDFFSLSRADHVRIRRLAAPAFAGGAVVRLRGMIRDIVDDELDRAAWGAETDLARGPSVNIPRRVLVSVLGVPPRDEGLFLDFADAMFTAFSPGLSEEDYLLRVKVMPAGLDLIRDLVAARRNRPAEDLLSDLVQASNGGARLSTAELQGLVASLITAGVGSLTQSICHSVLTLLRHPDQLNILRNEPSLLENAIHELNRFSGFVKIITPRYATESVSLGGVVVRPDEKVIPMLASAMRDPAGFPDPDRFDLRREPANLVFGGGSHFCLGSALAKAELETTIASLLARYPKMRLAGEPVIAPSIMVRNLVKLPVRMD
jgi:cytochrome P450 enzyme